MDKLKNLQEILKQMNSVLVAYSGGADSTFLLKIAKDTLKDNVLAVTANSETYTQKELESAKEFASKTGIRHIVIKTLEFQNKNFTNNPPDRCYYCKKELFSSLKKIALEEKINFIVDGSNFDDLKDYRPGAKAHSEFSIRSPLREAGLTKSEIREYSRNSGLPTWDKPSQACLSSRFPYGEEITEQKLNMVAKAEFFLHKLGFNQLRVRFYAPFLARIEIETQDFEKFFNPELKTKIIFNFKDIGFKYITLDLEGYRTGSMNEVLIKENVKGEVKVEGENI
ncbi:ATP-dependent sacrificial sulfur transferase LarE [Candidatus Poribacteria bacterium]|nr:ATP-dependent sacrificial sulfur transferase LarE [Candidatus Poribacteria bacterium]